MNLDTQYLSGLFRHKPECMKILADFLKKDKTDSEIISVGSGTGYFEYHLQKMLESTCKKIICVDPAYTSYAKEHPTENMKPEFATLDNVASEGKNISESIILLNWPSPDPVEKLMYMYEAESSYDYDAVVKYKPKMFFASYDKKGISGSIRFISLLNNQSIEQSAAAVVHKYPNQPAAVCAALAHKEVNGNVSNIINVDGTNYHLVYSHYLLGLVPSSFKNSTGNNSVNFDMPQQFAVVLYIREDHIENYAIPKKQYRPPVVDKMLINYQNKSFTLL